MRDAGILIAANASWNLVNFRLPLIRALQEKGYTVATVAPPDSANEVLRAAGVTVYDIAIDSRGVSPIRDLRLLLSYLAILQDLKPLAFLAFTAKPNIYGSMAARWLNIPVINTITGLGSAFLGGRGLETLVSLLYRIALRRSDHVYFHNPDDRDIFISRNVVTSVQSSVVPGSGVDTKRFTPDKNLLRSPPVTFLFLGRLLQDKGAMEFIQAAAMVRRKTDARFLMAGGTLNDVDALSLDGLQALIAETGIEILPPVTDVRPLILASDCVVLPSYREGLPRVLLEAAAMGKPVVATDVAGCRHVVDQGYTGLLCEARSAESLAEKMTMITRMSGSERAAMGMRGRRKVELEFEESLVVEVYLRRLEHILSSL